MIQVGDVAFIDEMPQDREGGVRGDLRHHPQRRPRRRPIAEVKKGDADVAVEMQGDTLVAHYTQTDQVKAAVTQGVLRAFVDGTNVALSGKPPTYRLRGRAGRGRLPQDHPVRHARPARLGGGDERQLRRGRHAQRLAQLQAAAPAPALAGPDGHAGRRPRQRHRRRSPSRRWRSSSGSARRPSGCASPAPGWPRSRCWSSAHCASWRSGCWPAPSPRPPRARSTWPTSSCCRCRS